VLELPEALDLTRADIEATPPGGPAYRPIVVANRNSTRLFLFKPSGAGAVDALVDGTHIVTITFRTDIGLRNPVFPHRDATPDIGTFAVSLPAGELTP
jgi:hypothetical protein